MNRKLLPVFIMLFAGAIASIMTAIMQYDLKSFLMIVFITLVIFYILGSVLKYVLDLFDRQNRKDTLDHGEVIPKQDAAEEASQEVPQQGQTPGQVPLQEPEQMPGQEQTTE